MDLRPRGGGRLPRWPAHLFGIGRTATPTLEPQPAPVRPRGSALRTPEDASGSSRVPDAASGAAIRARRGLRQTVPGSVDRRATSDVASLHLSCQAGEAMPRRHQPRSRVLRFRAVLSAEPRFSGAGCSPGDRAGASLRPSTVSRPGPGASARPAPIRLPGVRSGTAQRAAPALRPSAPRSGLSSGMSRNVKDWPGLMSRPCPR